MISIIVPVYNVEKYLKPCIESILNSTFRDFELILVDDGSPDNCGKICDEYALKDSRIKVIHQENQGVAAARNTALKVAKGEYISFVDSDDVIHPQMLEILYNAIQTGDYDLSMIFGKKVPEDFSFNVNHKLINTDKKIKSKEFDQLVFISGIYGLDDRYICVWNKLYKKELISGLWFENEGIGEDLEWNTRFCLSKMRRAVVVDSQLYYYRLRKGSAIRSGITPKVIESIGVYTKCLDYIPKDNRNYRAIVLKGIFTYMLQIRRICVNANDKKEAERVCSKIYEENIDEFLHSDINWFSKMRSIIGYKYPGSYNFIIKIFEFLPYRRVLAFLHKSI